MPASASAYQSARTPPGLGGHMENKTYLISIQPLKQPHGTLEKITDLLLRRIIHITTRHDRVQTRPVLVPLVLPERLLVAPDIRPVVLHVRE